MGRKSALDILRWTYESPYDIYNFNPDKAKDDLRYLLNPINGFFSIHAGAGELIGFCSFGADAQVAGGNYEQDALDIGLGIRPELTGQGRGARIIGDVLAFAAERFRPARYRVTIAAFNGRARKAWGKAGFSGSAEFLRPGDGMKFVILVKEGSRDGASAISS
jgi:ribosomal-protein-alanine N-acetyltransferase